MPVRVPTTSRLRFLDLVVVDGVTFWDLPELPDFLPQPDDRTHVVEGHDRLDILADRYYGDVTLGWVIAHANDIALLPIDLQVGSTLRIPSRRYVLDLLQRA